MAEPIPDATPEDSYSEGDHEVDWSNVDEVARQIEEIQAIRDPDERLAAAQRWAAEMAAG